MKRTILGIVSLTTLVGAGVAAQRDVDQEAVKHVVESFSAALAAGDSNAALALLSPDVQILESGNTENLDHYRSGHLRGDIAYASAVTRTRGPMQVVVVGDAAWVTSTAEVSGSFRDREVNSTTAELVVLSRTSAGWRIRAIHWSSRRRTR